MELHHSWLYGHKSTCLNTEMFTILIGMELIVWILQPTLLLHYWLLPLHNLDFARHSPWENTITQKHYIIYFQKHPWARGYVGFSRKVFYTECCSVLQSIICLHFEEKQAQTRKETTAQTFPWSPMITLCTTVGFTTSTVSMECCTTRSTTWC